MKYEISYIDGCDLQFKVRNVCASSKEEAVKKLFSNDAGDFEHRITNIKEIPETRIKMTFYINDVETFKRIHPEVDFSDLDPFICTYVLIGYKNHLPERYELYATDGSKLNINDLNGYQRAIILGDCVRYFEGKPSKYECNMFESVSEEPYED